jgi:hypothetical protein
VSSTNPPETGLLTAQVQVMLTDLVPLIDGEELRAQLETVISGLREPLRVAVAGRIKAGKSTLVNALLGQRVAATDVGECTRVVSWFRFGTQECVDIHAKDGTVTRRSLQPDGSLPDELGIPIDDISHLDVWVSNDALRTVTVIDTPGLASSNDAYSEATRNLLVLDTASRGAVAQADMLVLVLALDATRDDGATLAAFANQFGGLRNSAMNALTVLTRIDQLAEPGTDPLLGAVEVAAQCADELRMSSHAVVPVIGLLAETTGCGRITEADLELLRALAQLPPVRLRQALMSTRQFLAPDLPGPVTDRGRLLEILDLYGIETAVNMLAATYQTSSTLVTALRDRSGIRTLRERLWDDVGSRADVLKTVWALGALDRIVATAGGTDPVINNLRDHLEDLRLQPTFNRVLLFQALEAISTGELEFSTDLQDELRFCASAQPGAIDRAEALAGATRWRTFANSGRTSPAQRQAAEAACRHYELSFEALEPQSQQ